MVMRVSLDHVPEGKRERLAKVAGFLREEAGAELVVLFGSYARGDWVEDEETGYTSDFDILVVVATEELAKAVGAKASVAEGVQKLSGRTPVTLIVHDIKEINHELLLGHPILKMVWHARRAERALLTYEAEGWDFHIILVERETDGGTDIGEPIRRALHRVESEEWKHADVLLISDGEFPLDTDLVERVEAAREVVHLRVHGLVVGSHNSPAMDRLCSPLHRFAEWRVLMGEGG